MTMCLLAWCRANVFLARPDVVLYLDRFGPDLGPQEDDKSGDSCERSPELVTELDALAALEIGGRAGGGPGARGDEDDDNEGRACCPMRARQGGFVGPEPRHLVRY